MMKSMIALGAVVAACVSFGDVFESPAAVEKTEKGWSFRFAPRGEEKVNFVSIGTVEGEIGKGSVKADGWEFARGEGMKSGFETHFPHEHLMTMLEIEVESAKRPVLKGVEAKMVPYADAVDPKLFKLTQLDANTVFADFGRDIAIAGVSYPENLGKLDVWASWSPDFAAPGDEAGRIYGRTFAKDGATVNEFNAIHRGDSRYVVRSDKPIDAKKLVFDVKPYGYMKHITSETWEQKLQRLAWWQEARFGLFIHFGLYATPARQEWVKTLEQIPESKYDEFFKSFNPDRFDAKAWAKAAKAAGMKYAVLTTRHHEGFSLFDTKFSDYKITNTPFKRDLVKEFVDAFRAEGLKVGFYYSLLDWHHPDYPIDDVHPLRKGKLTDSGNGRSGAYDEVNKTRDIAKYRAFMKNQITELLTNYGKIDIVYGARSADDLVKLEEIKNVWMNVPGVNVHLTIDREQEGWDGHVGFVPAYLEEIGFSTDCIGIVCGPPIMIKFVLQGLKKLGFTDDQIYSTLELRMKCAIGKCGRCNIGNKFVCKDGPVFRFDQINELPPEY